VFNRNDSKSIVLTGYFSDEKRGMKISLDGNDSEYYGNSFVFYSKIFIQPPGSSMMDIYLSFSDPPTQPPPEDKQKLRVFCTAV
jgi:hypothetical protein